MKTNEEIRNGIIARFQHSAECNKQVNYKGKCDKGLNKLQIPQVAVICILVFVIMFVIAKLGGII